MRAYFYLQMNVTSWQEYAKAVCQFEGFHRLLAGSPTKVPGQQIETVCCRNVTSFSGHFVSTCKNVSNSLRQRSSDLFQETDR